MSTFRLATLNVHSFQKPFYRDSNLSDLVSIIEPLNLDLLVVQEIQNDTVWQKFCSRLSLSYSIYGPCYEDAFGNGIASRYPIRASFKQTSISCPGEIRGLIQCSLDGDHPFTQNRLFAVTHLDHLDEDLRLEQIKEFDPHTNNINILMGDMNALTRDDYSDDYYQTKIVDKRQKSCWEPPRFDSTKLISEEWGYEDSFKLINPQLKDEQVVTCAYGTRIDYIYIHPHAVDDQWKLTKCEIIDTKGATDHNGVFAEFTLKTT